MNRRKWSIFICLTILIVFCGHFISDELKKDEIDTDLTIEFTVSVLGDDKNEGTKEKPFASIQKVKEEIEKIRESGVSTPVTVWVREGKYILDATLSFEKGKSDNVTYIAYPGENVVITSCTPIERWENITINNIEAWCSKVPANANFSAVFKNGEILPLTRYPEEGFFLVGEEDHSGAMFNADTSPWRGWGLGDTEFSRDPLDVQQEFYNIDDVCVRLLHKWVGEITYLESYSGTTNRYKVYNPFTMSVSKGDRYYLENVFEGCDEAGEWYLDKKNDMIYYVPDEGEKMEDTVLYAPMLTQLISIEKVTNLSFVNLTFEGTDWEYPREFSDHFFAEYQIRFPQGEIDVAGVIEIENSSGIVISNCNLINLGQTAIRIGTMVKNSTIQSCYFENIGANAVFIDGYNTNEDEKITENIIVKDNLIDGYGMNFHGGIGVLLTHARKCEISNNEITDGKYTAISVGWVWGYDDSVTSDIKITDNLIYNIGQGWLSDMGGIYTLGEQKGTLISGNVIYDVCADEGVGGYGGWGIYLDEGSSYILVENNLVYACGSQGFNLHYGKENVVRNNIFALNMEGQIRLARSEMHTSLYLEHNIFLASNQYIYVDLNNDSFIDNGNIYWDYCLGEDVICSMKNENNAIQSLSGEEAIERGFFNGGLFIDPEILNIENVDFSFSELNNEVIEFEEWDISDAGTISDFQKECFLAK